MNRERVVCFVDGFNMYHALHAIRQPHLKWLDLRKLFTLLAKPKSQIITQILFFSAYPTWKPDSYFRHRQYVAALQASGVTPVMGHFKRKPKQCLNCKVKWESHEEKVDEDEKDDENKMLPPLEVGLLLNLVELISEQSFTRPPPRYSEASLVKELEKLGIGRPSTYATIMNKIQSRDYTVKESGRLKPTELGFVIAALLEASFTQIMNIGFTAEMEDNLERVAENQKDWKALIREFWSDFSPALEIAEKEAFVPRVQTDIDCPQCGAKLQKIWFKSKYFYGCTRYPECTYSAPIEEIAFNKEDYAADFNWDQKCPKCGLDMKLRHGRYGAFLGCSNYPDCKGIVNIPKKGESVIALENLPECPAIDCPGRIVARKSRFGKTFFSCSTYPECDVIVNNLDDLTAKYPDHVRTPYVKKGRSEKFQKKGAAKKETATKSPKKSTSKNKSKESSAPKKQRVGAPLRLTPELAAVLQANELSRADVLKKVWEYIKEKGLQDPSNKRLIRPDAKLAKVFGSQEPLDMFKMSGILSKHMEK